MKNNTATVTSQTRNQLFVDFTVLSIFIWGNKFDKANHINTTGAEETLIVGTLVGKKTATGDLQPCESDAADGSETPIGVLAETITLAIGANADLNYCIAGDVAAEELVFTKGGDTLATIVGGRSYRDLLQSETYGIKAVNSDNLTELDNS